jgi:hypothetical protein
MKLTVRLKQNCGESLDVFKAVKNNPSFNNDWDIYWVSDESDSVYPVPHIQHGSIISVGIEACSEYLETV